MPFAWSDFHRLAQQMVGSAQRRPGSSLCEATYRTAVGRAYYASYCHARAYAEKHLNFRRTKFSDDHAAVRRAMQKAGFVVEATALEDLRTWRNMCDYDDQVANAESLAKSSVQTAQMVLSLPV
jgi:hypothetical protein